VYEVGVYAYIEECMEKGEEDDLYCKILMETILNSKGYELVQHLLETV
jgi:hypothetical protein